VIGDKKENKLLDLLVDRYSISLADFPKAPNKEILNFQNGYITGTKSLISDIADILSEAEYEDDNKDENRDFAIAIIDD